MYTKVLVGTYYTHHDSIELTFLPVVTIWINQRINQLFSTQILILMVKNNNYFIRRRRIRWQYSILLIMLRFT